MSQSPSPVAVVAGVGPGLGAALCRRLAAAGYTVAAIARTVSFCGELAAAARAAGATVRCYSCDLTLPDTVDETLARVESELGAPKVLIYHAGAFLMKSLEETTPADMRGLWEVNCLGAYLCARRVVPGMLADGGTLVFTGATAGIKAGARFSAFGASKFALRGLAQGLARELGPQGIHVAHVVIDGIINTRRSRDRTGTAVERCLDPDAIAESYLHLIQQDRSAWTFELDLRPDVEPF